MKSLLKRITTISLALSVALSSGIMANAASPYSLNVEGSNVIFMRDGKATNTFTARSSSITLTADDSGYLTVSFYNTKNVNTKVPLKSQSTLEVDGDISLLTLSKSLSKRTEIEIAEDAEIKTLKISAPTEVTIKGDVGSLSVIAAADVRLKDGANVGKATLTTSKASLHAEPGATVDDVDAASDSSLSGEGLGDSDNDDDDDDDEYDDEYDSDLTLRVPTLSISRPKKLSSLTSQLNDSVKAYDEDNKSVSGKVSWVQSSSTTVEETDTYDFIFTASKSKYGKARGTVKIYVGDTDEEYEENSNGEIDLDVSSFHIEDSERLRNLVDELEDSVTAEDSDGDEVSGSCEWVSSGSTTVKKSGTYKFIFKPKSSKYNDVKGSINIYVGDDSDDDDDNSSLELRISSISTDSGETLGELTDELNKSIKVYNKDSDVISGKATWLLPESTTVNRSASYKFSYKATESKYGKTTGRIDIYVDGDKTLDSKEGLVIETDPIDLSAGRRRLGGLTSELNKSITVYDEDGKTVKGVADWKDSGNTVVDETDVFEFTFDPSRSKYDSVTGEIKIRVDGDDGDGDELNLDISDITVSSGSRLSSIVDELNDAVEAYDEDDDKVTGTAKWSSSGSTKVKDGGEYKFTFTPKSSKYGKVTDYITVYTD